MSNKQPTEDTNAEPDVDAAAAVLVSPPAADPTDSTMAETPAALDLTEARKRITRLMKRMQRIKAAKSLPIITEKEHQALLDSLQVLPVEECQQLLNLVRLASSNLMSHACIILPSHSQIRLSAHFAPMALQDEPCASHPLILGLKTGRRANGFLLTWVNLLTACGEEKGRHLLEVAFHYGTDIGWVCTTRGVI
jgi:hypothetical protein